MIQIYSPGNTEFDRNGDCVLMPTSCKVKATLNGSWEMTIKHPLDREGRWKRIEEEAVVSAPAFHLDQQLYRIYKREKEEDGITAYARPVFLDSAKDCMLLDVRPTDRTGQQALDSMTAGTRYSGESDITDLATAYYVRKNLVEAISGDLDQSFLNRWGGEIFYRNYTVIINKRIGADNGLQIVYGRNLKSIRETVNTEKVVTRIIPVAYNGYTLDGETPWVDSPRIGAYPTIRTSVVQFSDVKLQEDCMSDEIGFMTMKQLREELIRRSNAMFEAGCDRAQLSMRIDMIDLSKTLQYKEYKQLEKVSLGDTVHCRHPKLEIASEARVLTLTWDCIRNRPDTITLGTEGVDQYWDAFSSVLKNVNDIITPNGSVAAEKIEGVLNAMQAQLRYQKDIAHRQDVRAILFEDLDPNSPTYGAMCLGSAGFQIADKRTEDGTDWEWETFGTAKGFSADYFIGGVLSSQNYEAGKQGFRMDMNTGEIDAPALKIDTEEIEVNVKKSVKATTIPYYALSNSAETAPDLPEEDWSRTVPDKDIGEYIWRKDKLLYGDGTEEWMPPVMVSGLDGEPGTQGEPGPQGPEGQTGPQGPAGPQGLQGPKGTDGKTYYTWLKYADDAKGGGMSDSPAGKSYIGLAYNKESSDESSDPTLYQWSLIKGEKGDQGVAGGKGADGKTLYTWIKYATDAKGSNMSDSPDGKTYIGLAYNKTSQIESTTASDYAWSLIQGPKGETGAQGPKGDTGPQGPQGLQGPKGTDGKTYYTWLKYADDAKGGGMSDSPAGKSYIGLAYNKESSDESSDPTLYQWSLIKGEKGDQGVAGGKGADGKTLYTWIKYATDAKGSNMSDSPDGKTYIGLAYNKTSQIESTTASDYAWSLIQGPKGETGAQGPKGDTGAQGPQGAAGAKGDKGDKGETGATGAKGDQGPKGDQGDQGTQGINLVLASDIVYTNSSYPTNTYTLSEEIILGETYTVTIWGSVGSGKTFCPYIAGGYNNFGAMKQVSDGVYKVTGKITSWNANSNGHKDYLYIYPMPSNVSAESTINRIKLEHGSVDNPTWTPSPLDVEDEITDIRKTVVEQATSFVSTCEEMILSALTSYTSKGDYDELKRTVESQLKILSDQITLNFTETTKSLTDLNNSLQSQINTITKYFAFDVNGLTIGQQDSPYKVVIDNDRYSMLVNDTEVMWIANGEVHTPEQTITKRLNLFGYIFEQDSAGNVNCEYVG